ncbi:carbohydrate-binding module family 32 protein [Cadophora sp. MPI-SDFR-AT-0126]|nr:carbohydrate-binding module family 32 protein [Leotiomycetes sp. MPI-SDFR-AT-0126]
MSLSVPVTSSSSSTSSTSSALSSSSTYSATNTAATSSATIIGISVDSFQVGNEGPKAIDGIRSTIWHSRYKPDIVPLPHNAVLDLGTTQQVTGLTYLPRQDVAAGKPLNGNIGQYRIETSTDNNTWTLATNGAFKDDATLKTTTFPTASARYVRITALTEAGNRGPWTSAAEFGISILYNSSAPSTPSLGKWGPVIQLGIVAAGAFVVPGSGNVIGFSRSGKKDGGAGTGNTWTAIYNFATGAVTQRNVAETKHDMFCPGMSHDFNGRTILSGGQDAAPVSGYTPASDSWAIMPNMSLLRGYQGQTTLSDGRTFIIGGSWLSNPNDRGGKNAEIYDPATNKWTLLPGCPVGPMLTNDNNGIYRSDNHGWLFAWSNATIFQAGPSKNMHWYDAKGSGSYTSVGTRAADNDAMCGVAVLYDAAAGKIFTTAGAPSYENAGASAAAYLITIGSSGSTPSVVTLPSLHYARSFANGVILPSGQVFVIGGQPYPVTFTDTNAILQPEMWDPVTQTFQLMPPHQIPRCYHSVAVLLLDGTVFTAGGGLCGSCAVNHLDAEIYSPGYLFNSDGSAATRPVITSSPSSVRVGGTITVVTDSPVVRFSLIRYGSATHTVNTDQRRLAFDTGVSGTSNTITVPGDPGVALPGFWMLFALNAQGVPSVAKTVQVTL